MTDIPYENYALVVTVTFLSVFFILASTMPYQLIPEPIQAKNIHVPQYFEAIEVQRFAEMKTINLTRTTYTEGFDLGGWHFYWWHAYYNDFSPHNWIIFQHCDQWWVFKWNYRDGRWYDSTKGLNVDLYGQIAYDDKHYYINKEILDQYYDPDKKLSGFLVKWDDTQLEVYFAFNTTKYSKPSEAWDHDELYALIGINFDQRNTTFNAWNLIGALLFFKLPNVHPVINMLIAIPIWVMIAWLIYILILKAIPFVGG